MMTTHRSKDLRTIFVIMPFRATPTRTREDLSSFFENNLKYAIERCDNLPFRHVVSRSDDTFNITAQIIRELYEADIVICDLSGYEANPNVMYELGVRLSISSKPVILIREQHPDNRPIFDIAGFYAFEYNPHQYARLEQHILAKIRKFEAGEERYVSPVLDVLKTSPRVVDRIARRRTHGILEGMGGSFYSLSMSACMAVQMFAEKAGIELVPGGDLDGKRPKDLLDAIAKKQDALRAVTHLVPFQFRPTAPPAVIAFLQSPPLEGFLPPQVAIPYGTLVLQHYWRYLATDYLWFGDSMLAVLEFIRDTLFLENATDAVFTLFASPSDSMLSSETYAYFVETVLACPLISDATKREFFGERDGDNAEAPA